MRPRDKLRKSWLQFSVTSRKIKATPASQFKRWEIGTGEMSQSLEALTTLSEDRGSSISTRWLITLWDSFFLKDYTSQLALRPEGGAMGGSEQQSFPSL